jgi:hypothetical protein
MRQTTRHGRLGFSSSLLFVAVLCLNLLPLGWQHADAQSRKGYRLSDTHITVDTPEHWKNWSLPTHAVDIIPDGEVKPHFFRDRYNILDDQETFTQPLPDFKLKRKQTAILNVDSTEKIDVTGNVITKKVKGELVPLYGHFLRPGISRVGSNLADADHILDGDPTTYWEPDPDDPLDEWWIEIDLARVVAVDELVLRFVGEDLGDPFWRFRVLAAPDQEPTYEEGAEIAYSLAGGPARPTGTSGFSVSL